MSFNTTGPAPNIPAVPDVPRDREAPDRLTEHERFIIGRARQVALALRGGEVRGQLAAELLAGLAGLAERLGGGNG
jgi:hypothetical protein